MAGRILLIIGTVFIIAGILVERNIRIPVGRLPGDIVVKRENWTIFVPLMTSLIASVILTVIFSLLRRK
jgi:hypothetical protein